MDEVYSAAEGDRLEKASEPLNSQTEPAPAGEPPSSTPSIQSSLSRHTKTALAIALLSALFFACLCAVLASRFPHFMLVSERLYDSYFGSDLPRTFANMVNRHSSFYFAYKHPLYGLVFLPAGAILRHGFGMIPQATVIVFLFLNALIWALLLFACLYHVTGRRLADTCVYLGIAFCSASSLFWFIVPESFCFGATSILVPLVLLTHPKTAGSFFGHAIAGACSAAFTITNWISGIIACAVAFKPRRALAVIGTSLALLTALCGMQWMIAPSSTFFLDLRKVHSETFWLHQSTSMPLPVRLRNVLVNGVLPLGVDSTVVKVKATAAAPEREFPRLFISDQSPRPWLDHSFIALWGLLLLAGLASAVREIRKDRFVLALLGVLLFQVGLHLFYSVYESFMYTPHFTGLLVMTAAMTSRTRFRGYSVAAGAILLLYLGVHNFGLHGKTAGILMSFRLFAQ